MMWWGTDYIEWRKSWRMNWRVETQFRSIYAQAAIRGVCCRQFSWSSFLWFTFLSPEESYNFSEMNSRYTALDALRLISPYDEYFHCESCNGVLVAESDKLAAEELGDGDDNASKRRHDKLKDMLSKMEVCPLLIYLFWFGIIIK